MWWDDGRGGERVGMGECDYAKIPFLDGLFSPSIDGLFF